LLFATTTGAEGTISYSYDATGQLTSATGATSETYTYDPAGNRAGSGYQTGPANRLQSDGTYNYTYDAEGNLVEKTEIATGKTWRFTWDQRNRLTHVTVVDSNGIVVREADYTYDVFNRLIGRRLDYDGDGPQAPEEFWTLYDTPETAAEIAAAIYEPGTLLSNPWADVQNGSLTSRYLYTRAVDEVFARLVDDQGQLDLSWYIADRLGSVRQQVQTDGTVLNEITYDSFGNILTETNPLEGDRFKFTGREYDDLTGLYYYRARWYDANTGKFISEDPLGFAAGDYNLNRYVLNDPANVTDPTGLWPRWLEELAYDFQLLQKYPWEMAKGAAQGLKMGSKALVNGTANAGWQTVTLGFGDRVEVWAPTETEIRMGYYQYETHMTCMSSMLLGAGMSKMAQAPGLIGRGALLWDTAGNAVSVSEGVYGIYRDGADWQDALNIGMGSFGLLGNVPGLKQSKGIKAAERAPIRSGARSAGEALELRAQWRLLNLEGSTPGAHFLGRHSPMVSDEVLRARAVGGIDPQTGKTIINRKGKIAYTDSTKFTRYSDMLEAHKKIKRIITGLRRIPKDKLKEIYKNKDIIKIRRTSTGEVMEFVITIDMCRPIGYGYIARSGIKVTGITKVRAVVDEFGNIKTMYPLIPGRR